jgi:hypothetical protein
MDTNTSLKDDLLHGADEIANYLGRKRWQVYYGAARGYLPIGRIGQTLVARKSELDRALSGAALVANKEVV